MMNKQSQMHPEDRRNMIVFSAMALVAYLLFNHFVMGPQMAAMQVAQKTAAIQATLPSADDPTSLRLPRAEILARGERVPFNNGVVAGTIPLTGGRMDDLELLNYPKTLDPASPKVSLLSPAQGDYPLYAEFGWVGDADAKVALPDAKTVWTADARQPNGPVALSWDNGHGLVFKRTYAPDDKYMFTVTQTVTNKTGAPVTLYPYALIAQQGLPEALGKRIHEGPISYIDGALTEINYGKMGPKFVRQDAQGTNGWIGITEEYWFAGLVPAQGQATKYSFSHVTAPTKAGRDRYQVDATGAALTIQPGQTAESKTLLYAGAKEVPTLDAYEKKLNIPHLDLAVDFGWLYFMTKPLYYLLRYLHGMVGNMGVAIILLTVIVRMLLFPLATVSFKSFAKLRKIAPEMKALRDQHGKDQQKLQAELVKLYQQEKVNPMAGCLPLVLQIPIFFALYRVMVITIEARHAPFFGWIHDLSAPDPTTIFNGFGLIPWHPPLQLMIGAWPCMMLAVQVLSRNMNPPPQDKMQQAMINFMPFFFCYIMSQFAAGLVIYWTFSGLLALIQQVVIMRMMGVPINLLGRSKVEKDMAKQIAEQPAVHPGAELAEEQLIGMVTGDDTPNPDGTVTPTTPARNPGVKRKRR